ncbi:hypothetical protein GCM10027442_36470 [Emticicia fontis]
MVCWQIFSYKAQQKKFDKYLHNNIEFEGLVTDLKRTNNHSFGIMQLKLLSTNVEYFNDSVPEGIFPYRIQGDIAEVYGTVSYERKLNDTLKIVSNERRIYINSFSSKETSDLTIIYDFNDRAFVRKNSILKKLEVPLFPYSPFIIKRDSVIKKIFN